MSHAPVPAKDGLKHLLVIPAIEAKLAVDNKLGTSPRSMNPLIDDRPPRTRGRHEEALVSCPRRLFQLGQG